MTAVSVEGLHAEHLHGRVVGIGEPMPRLSWVTVTAIESWLQAAYEIELDGTLSLIHI